MPCRQSLRARDPGNDLVVKGRLASCKNPMKDADGAVVECRVSPDQKRTAFVLGEFLADQRLEQSRLIRMPRIDAGLVIGRRPIALRLRHLHDAVIRTGDEPAADLLPDRDELLGGLALVQHEEYIGGVQRIDRLDRHVIGISRADADDKNFSHQNSMPA